MGKKNLNEQARATLLGHWWNDLKLVKNVVKCTECYIEDCAASIVGNSLYVEVAPGHVLRENYDHEPTFKDVEVLRTKVRHLKTIDYERYKN